MAQEQIAILNIETGEAVKNVKELKEQIKILKENVSEAQIGSTEYQEGLKKLSVYQNALKDAMYGTTATMEDLTNAANGTSESYNSLVHQMAAMKAELRNIDTSTEEGKESFRNLAEQINGVNDKLKNLDAMQGNYQRNVGNYKSALEGLEGGFRATAGGASAVINPIKNMTLGLKTMSATPVIAILGLLANIIAKVMEGLKSSEGNVRAVTESFSAFSVVGDAITKIMQGLAKVIAGLGDGLMWLMEKLNLVSDAMRERQALAQAETELLQKERDNIYKNADAELKSAQLRQQAADKIKFTHQERIGFLEEAMKIEEDIAKRAMEAAQLEYDIIKRKNALTESSTEELKAEAEAYAKLVKAETDYFNKTKEMTAQVTEARNAARAEALAAAKALSDAEIKLLQAELTTTKKASAEKYKIQKEILDKQYQQQVTNAKATIKDRETLHKTLLALEKKYHSDEENLVRTHDKSVMDIEKKRLENNMNIWTSGTREYMKEQMELRKWEMENLRQGTDETNVEFNSRRLAAQRAYYESVQALNNKIVDEGRLAYENVVNSAANGSEAQLEAIVNLKRYELEHIKKQMGETDDAFYARQLAAQTAYNDAVNALVDSQVERERQALENKMNSNADDTFAYLASKIELKKYELDTLHQMEEESDEAFYARKLQMEQEYVDAKRELAAEQVALAQNVASGVSSLLGSIADIYESDTQASEKELKKARNLRIAGATIDMLSGVVTAIATAMQLGPIAGPIMGAINSAAVIAAGVANIQKIKSQSTSASSSSSSTPSTSSPQVSAPSIDTNIPVTRTLTSASEEERLNRASEPQQVYILDSDLQAAETNRKVQIAETSF